MSFCPMVEAKIPREKTVNRLTMPHVITQWKPGQFSRDGMTAKEQNKADKKLAKSIKSTKNQNLGADSSSYSASSITTPKSKRWDFGSIRHKTQASSDVAFTPSSAVDPVFEMEHVGSSESPNSSTHSSSWIFELEDTSQIALGSKRSAIPGSQLEFQSSAITSRSVIKVIDQTIAAIEADNRKLLSRAIAAESTVKALREHNFNLQLKVDRCEKTHQRRPRAVASQPILHVSRHKPTTPITPIQLTGFDQVVTQTPLPTSPSKSSAVKTTSTNCYSPPSTHPPYSPARNVPNKPLPSTPTRPRRQSESTQQTSQLPTQFSPTRSPPQFSPIKSPILPSRRKSRYMSKQHKLSFSKPLPPIGQPSASPLNKGEIGLGIGPREYQELESDLATNERGFITGLFNNGDVNPREMEEKKWI